MHLLNRQRLGLKYYFCDVKSTTVYNQHLIQCWVSSCLVAKLNMITERVPLGKWVIKLLVSSAVSICGLFRLGGWDKLPSRGKFLSRAPGNTNLLITHDLAAKRGLSSSMGPPVECSLLYCTIISAGTWPVCIRPTVYKQLPNLMISGMPGNLWLILAIAFCL